MKISSGWLGWPGQRIRVNAGVFVVFVLLWDLAVRATGVRAIVVPPPLDVARALVDGLLLRGIYWDHVLVTVIETVAGFGIGALVGLLLGVLVAEIRVIRQTLYPYIVAFQTIPKVAIAPLFVIWFGFGMTSKIAIAATISFFPIVVNVITGLTAADPSKAEMLRVFGASPWMQFRLVRFPSALPYVFAGLDIAIVLSVIGAIVAEFVGAQKGIGYLIMQYNFNLNTAGIFALLIILSAIGILFHMIVLEAQERVVFWASPTSSTTTP
jgi:NitT/TauT family transport system permease protein